MVHPLVSFDLSPEWAKAVHIENLQALEEVYRDLDCDIADWQRTSDLACPTGCGHCCTRFTPDITAVEAEYLAVFLLQHYPEKTDKFDGLEGSSSKLSSEECPLFDPDSAFHCSVYAARPLVCRLFAFSGFRDKSGHRRFAPCRQMPVSDEYSALQKQFPSSGSREIAPDDSITFPLLGVFGSRVEAADFEPSAERELLPSAVLRAVSRIRLKRQLASGQELSGSDTSIPETPVDGGFSGRDTA
ncbi:MAG: YkgJ family cysteine cluster protein [Spirochaetales bacterium]|nr:YkgJ family cysteine cluster protein [Spirochaetales bacterium]